MLQRQAEAKKAEVELQRRWQTIEASAIYNFKGGVGKSTTAISLSTYLAAAGRRVWLFDCDLQANTSAGLLPTIETPTLTEVLRDASTLDQAARIARTNLWIIPASEDMDKAGEFLGDDLRKLRRLVNAQIMAGGFVNPKTGARELPDYILFDTAGLTSVTKAAILCAKNLIIPLELEFFSFQGVATVLSKLEGVMTEQEHSVFIKAVIPFKVNASRTLTKAYYQELRKDEDLGDALYPPVHISVAIPESQGETKSIFEYAPNSRAAKELEAIAQYYMGILDLDAYLQKQDEEEAAAALQREQEAASRKP